MSAISFAKGSPFLAVAGGLYLVAALFLLFHSPTPEFAPPSPSDPAAPKHPHHSPAVDDADYETPSDAGSSIRTGLSSLWPASQGGDPVKSKGNLQWKDHNRQALHDLFGCLATETCTGKQDQVVIFEANEFSKSVYAGYTSGEGIWARSITEVVRSLGYTYLYARDMEHVGTFHLMLPDLIKAVVVNDRHLTACAEDKECIRTNDNPQGIPLQSLFALSFWAGGFSPLGKPWSVVPEEKDRTDHATYLGYSIEHQCMAEPVPAHTDKKRQVWILAKNHYYFYDKKFPYSADIFERASKELDIEFIGAWNDEGKPDADYSWPGVTRLGGRRVLPEAEFTPHLKGALATVGIGRPFLSPTPYYSVCYGVPFLNPTQPNGNSQHPDAAPIGEENGLIPVREHDDAHFISQLRLAIAPHARYVAPWMTHEAMEVRVDKWLQTDWTAEAKKVDENEWRKWQGKDFRHVVL